MRSFRGLDGARAYPRAIRMVFSCSPPYVTALFALTAVAAAIQPAQMWLTKLLVDSVSASGPAAIDYAVRLVLAIGGDDGSVAGFDVESGELLWRSLPDSIYGGSPIVAEIGGETQVLMLSPNFVAGLDPRSVCDCLNDLNIAGALAEISR